MGIVNGTFSVTCSQCDEIYSFDATEAEFERMDGEEKDMGIREHYLWEYLFNCECENEIEVEYSIWEYPTGIYDDSTIEVNGGTSDGEFDYDFSEALI